MPLAVTRPSAATAALLLALSCAVASLATASAAVSRGAAMPATRSSITQEASRASSYYKKDKYGYGKKEYKSNKKYTNNYSKKCDYPVVPYQEFYIPGKSRLSVAIEIVVTSAGANLCALNATDCARICAEFLGGEIETPTTATSLCLVHIDKATFDLNGTAHDQHDKIFSAEATLDFTVVKPQELADSGVDLDFTSGFDCVIKKSDKAAKKEDVRTARCTSNFVTSSTLSGEGLLQPGVAVDIDLHLHTDKNCYATVAGGTALIPYQEVETDGRDIGVVDTLDLTLFIRTFSGVADFQKAYYY